MPAVRGINRTLRFCETTYQRAAADPDQQKLYAKLALLELAGWIEMSVDELVNFGVLRRIVDPENVSFAKSTIEKVYSFNYAAFRKLLSLAIGITAFEKIEKKICRTQKGIVVYQRFKATLNTLKKVRDDLAHTHTSGVAVQIPAPSTTLVYFKDIRDGLTHFQKQFRKCRVSV